MTTWLDEVNMYRAVANLPNVSEDTSLSTADQALAVYEVQSGYFGHNPPDNQYTTAAQQSNLYGSSDPNTLDTAPVDAWMAEVFHGIALIDPLLAKVGWGRADSNSITPPPNSTINMVAALDVLSDRTGGILASPSNPIMWPDIGKNASSTTYVPEIPDARSMFGYSAGPSTWNPAGQPIFLQLGSGNVANPNDPTQSGVTYYGLLQGILEIPPGGTSPNPITPVNVIEIDETNYSYPTDNTLQTTARNILATRGAVVLLPQQSLTAGGYTAVIMVNGTLYTWSFTVGTNQSTPICLGFVAPNVLQGTNIMYGQPTFVQGQPFQGTYSAAGGNGGPYTFTGSQVPDGLILTPYGGHLLTISGTAPQTGPIGVGWTYMLTVTDNSQQSTQFPLSVGFAM